MTVFTIDDTRKSLYAILAKKLTSGNDSFQVSTKTGCRDSRNRAGKIASDFKKWADKEAKKLQSVKGNIIPVDESILMGFPAPRPTRCAPLESIRIMLDKDGYQTSDPSKNVIRSNDGNVTHDWTRSYWFKGKKRDYYIYKEKIDNYIKELENQSQSNQKPKSEISLEKNGSSFLLLPLLAIGLVALSGSKTS